MIDDTVIQKYNTTYNNNTSHLIKKFSYIDWCNIERKISTQENDVLIMLSDCIKKINEKSTYTFYINDNIKYKIIGDNLYINLIRNIIITKFNIIKFTTYPITNIDLKSNKKNNIILNNLKKKIEQFINILTNEQIYNTNIITSKIIQFEILEFIGITLLVQLHKYYTFLINNFDFNIYKLALSTFISIKLFIKNCTNISKSDYLFPNKSNILSIYLIKDMEIILSEFLSINNDIYKIGSINDIYKYTPHLLNTCDHYNIIPGTYISPHKSQFNTMKCFVDYFDNGFLILLQAMIGSGKTTLIVPFANHIKFLRNNNYYYKDLQLIFCCNIYSVKLQVANLCFNSSIPFGMAHIHTIYYDINNNIVNKDSYHHCVDEIRIINNYNCHNNDNNRIVIIGSPDVIELLLKHSKNYVLFIDEPTVGLDSKFDMNSPLMISNVKLFLNLPKRSILSSATLPSSDTKPMQYIINNIINNFPDITINTIINNEIFIGCKVITYSNNFVTPHDNCISYHALQHIISHVNSNPFLGRMYTFDILNILIQRSQLTTLLDVFDNVQHINANSIKNQSLKTLNSLNNDDIIINCCKIINYNNFPSLDINLLGTTQSYMFPNMTLIAIEYDIINTALSIFDNLLNLLLPKRYESIMSEYCKNKTSFYKKKTKLIESQKKSKFNYHSDEKLSKIERNKDLNDNIGEPPKINFPNYLQINSYDHLHLFNNLDKNIKPRVLLSLENIDFDNLAVNNDIKLLLMCGVGIYSPSTLDSKYTNEIINLASSGSLAFIVSNYEMCYGTNYPFNSVIITKEFADNHSFNTLFQLMGRAGRHGKSWSAYAYIPNNLADVFQNYMHNPSNFNIEVENLSYLLNKIDSSYNL